MLNEIESQIDYWNQYVMYLKNEHLKKPDSGIKKVFQDTKSSRKQMENMKKETMHKNIDYEAKKKMIEERLKRRP